MLTGIARTVTLMICLSASARAQHGSATPPATAVPAEAKQFAFLLGEFELAVKPSMGGLAARIHGVPKLIGVWKGWRALDGFGIEDELRITDEAGNPKSLTHAIRYYDAAAKHWRSMTVDAYRGTFTSSTAQWRDKEMIATASGTDAEGKVYVARGRYYDITPTSFRFRQDRSYDEGRTWGDTTLEIEAKRVAANASRQ